MKWVSLAFFVIGVLSFIWSMTIDTKSNFDDGSFLVQIILMMAGAACIAFAVGIFAIKLFVAI